MTAKRWRWVIALLLAYGSLLLSVQGGLWVRSDTAIWQRLNFTTSKQYGVLTCVTDISTGPVVTGLAALTLPLAFAASWPRRLAMTGGWFGLTVIEAVQHAAVPVQGPPPVPAYREPPWCSRLQHIADLGVAAPASALAPARHTAASSQLRPGPGPVAHPLARTRYSFPSGHALRLTYDLSLAAGGLFHGTAAAWTGVAVLALAQGLVLVGLHWHWATDVLGAWLLAAAGSALLVGRASAGVLAPARRRKPGRSA